MGGPPDNPATVSAAAAEDPITVAEITDIAKRNLPKQVWDYYASGADEEVAVTRNKTAFDRFVESCDSVPIVHLIDSHTNVVSFYDHEYCEMSRPLIPASHYLERNIPFQSGSHLARCKG